MSQVAAQRQRAPPRRRQERLMPSCRTALGRLMTLSTCCVAQWREPEYGGYVEFQMSDRRAEQHWPCCSEEQTQLFASVVGSGMPGVWHIEFDRDATRRDLLWDVPFVVANNQRVALSGQAAHVRKGVRPSWAPGYVVQSGAGLGLMYLNTGELAVEHGAVGLNVTDSVVVATAQFHGGVVRIVRSMLNGGMEVLFGMVALEVLNSTVFVEPVFDVGSPTIMISSSELRHWLHWAVFATNNTDFVATDVTVTLHMDLNDGRATGSTLGVVNSCQPGPDCNAGFKYECEPGFEGLDCTSDIDECAGTHFATGDALNGGCQQICVNTLGTFHCECNPGYEGVDEDDVICEDVDECALMGCVHAPPIVRECRATRNISLVGSSDELAECEGIQNAASREICYENLKDEQFQSYHSLNISWVAVLPVVFDSDSNITGLDNEQLQRSNMFLAKPRCDSFCTNFEGTYQCVCDPGYDLDLETDIAGHTCRDLDECMDEGSGDPCLSYVHSKCMNFPGGVTCSCQEGYVGWPIGPAGDGVNTSECTLITVPTSEDDAESTP